ncbi:hypothetical protein KIL84_014680 [Mauremys mutica]|uniref:Uncharacterized protein n=1 Tax=Mauremys mutica TaxID=74926 RepID=A0A9D4B8I9_9SAUR|nr:hypothetical protein KIL84_014680 [Mauremys mutica]
MNRHHSQSTELSPAIPKGKLTMPIMPTMLKRKNLSGKLKSLEDRELEKMKQLQQETQKE